MYTRWFGRMVTSSSTPHATHLSNLCQAHQPTSPTAASPGATPQNRYTTSEVPATALVAHARKLKSTWLFAE
jgi:hypothetical protein